MKTIYKKLLFLFLILPFSAFAQTLSGVVLDAASNQPLPGVNVIVKGANKSTTTDFDGKFQLGGLNNGDVVQFSFIGYTAQEVKYSGQKSVSISLVEEANQLQEVVVQVGYGSVKKKDATGSATVITTKDFNTVSETKLLYDPGFSSIDAVIVKRAAKDYVMVLKDNTRANRNLKIAFASSPYGPYSEVSAAFTEPFVEGPTVEKVGDDYMIYFDVYKKKIYGAVKTRDFIHFTNETAHISVPQGHKHGTICKVPKAIVDGLIKNQK